MLATAWLGKPHRKQGRIPAYEPECPDWKNGKTGGYEGENVLDFIIFSYPPVNRLPSVTGRVSLSLLVL